jgi:mannose-6-phosphate isomerase-like protein (cupin superfamily)
LPRSTRLRVFAALFAASAALSPGGQQKTITEPDPSYREDAPSNRRHPGLDTDVTFYFDSWKSSPVKISHGGLREQAILKPGDPFQPAEKGAVLRYLKTYGRAELAPGARTSEYRDAKEQVFLYIWNGAGTLTAGGASTILEKGMAVVIPAGMTYRLANPGPKALEMVLAAEGVPAGFVPAARISVGRYRDTTPILGAHWAHVGMPFAYDVEPRFAKPMGFIVVSMDAFDIAQPHGHPAPAEEIWLQLEGRSLLMLGNRLFVQEPGWAFLVPPNNRVPHSSINPGREAPLWLFFGCRQ